LPETGDPLVGVNQVVDGYHLQDEALQPWFTGERPSSALGHQFSISGPSARSPRRADRRY
jgi:hypothetical protein